MRPWPATPAPSRSAPARSGPSASSRRRCRARSRPRRSANCRARAAPAPASRSRSTAPCRSRTAARRGTSPAPRTTVADRSTCRDRRGPPRPATARPRSQPHRQRIGAHQPAVALRPKPAAQAAHHAEAAEQANRAIDEADDQEPARMTIWAGSIRVFSDFSFESTGCAERHARRMRQSRLARNKRVDCFAASLARNDGDSRSAGSRDPRDEPATATNACLGLLQRIDRARLDRERL